MAATAQDHELGVRELGLGTSKQTERCGGDERMDLKSKQLEEEDA